MPLFSKLFITLHRCIAVAAVSFLLGCSNTPPKPVLTATGYFDDNGSVRLWRKDLNNTPIVLISDYIPYNTANNQIVTTYEYLDGSLSQIKRQIITKPETSEQLRFDEQGELTFNQRVFPERKEMIDASSIEYLTYQAQQVLQMSHILQTGKVRLTQGKYYQGKITTCAGQPAYLNLNKTQLALLHKQLKNRESINLAWLVSSIGQELLLITDRDICATEPMLASLD